MKSVKDIAEICGVSKTTVQRTVKELNITPLNYKNMFVFDDTDVQKIVSFIVPNAAVFGSNDTTATNDTEPQNKETNATETATQSETNATNETNAELIEVFKSQLSEKDKQITDLLEKLSKQMEITALQSQNIAFLTKTIEENKDAESKKMDNTETNETKGFFYRLFHKQ